MTFVHWLFQAVIAPQRTNIYVRMVGASKRQMSATLCATVCLSIRGKNAPTRRIAATTTASSMVSSQISLQIIFTITSLFQKYLLMIDGTWIKYTAQFCVSHSHSIATDCGNIFREFPFLFQYAMPLIDKDKDAVTLK